MSSPKKRKKMQILRTVMGVDSTPCNTHLRGVLYLNRHEQVEKIKLKTSIIGYFRDSCPQENHTYGGVPYPDKHEEVEKREKKGKKPR